MNSIEMWKKEHYIPKWNTIKHNQKQTKPKEMSYSQKEKRTTEAKM